MADAPRADGFEWGFTALPAVEEGGERASYSFFEQIWMPKDAVNKDLGKQFIAYLYSDEAQELIAENYYRPVDQTILKKHADTFDLKVKLTTIKDFGGWDAVQKKHFADGGVFDEIYEE